jgi:hypothetical protein
MGRPTARRADGDLGVEDVFAISASARRRGCGGATGVSACLPHGFLWWQDKISFIVNVKQNSGRCCRYARRVCMLGLSFAMCLVGCSWMRWCAGSPGVFTAVKQAADAVEGQLRHAAAAAAASLNAAIRLPRPRLPVLRRW